MAVIDRSISKYIVFSDDTITHALKRISENKSGFVVAVSQHGRVVGVLTDGDFRRWVVSQSHINLERPVSEIANTNFTYVLKSAGPEAIAKALNEKIRFIIVLDENHHLVGVGRQSTGQIQIGSHQIGPDSPCFMIAEIGNNHNGSFDLAKKLVDHAKEAGADCAKFQMRQMDVLYANRGNSNDHSEDLGAQYTLDLLSRFQISNDQLFKIFDYCKSIRILPLCTPWEEKSLELLDQYGMPAFKVASADFINQPFLTQLAKTGKPLICSTGMSSDEEIRSSISYLQTLNSEFALLHCNSTYPAPFKDINLKYMLKLKSMTNGGVVGYSGHERGYHVALAAVAMGAKVIEKHFTLDRSMEGNDHRVSLLPDEFAAMLRQTRELEQALGDGESRGISQGELMNREVLGKSLIAKIDIPAEAIVTEDMVEVKSPGKGLAPYRKKELIGKRLHRSLAKGEFFYPSDVDAVADKSRLFKFRRPFGVPVRYHDVQKIIERSNLNLVEFHFSYKDLELNIDEFFSQPFDLDFVVHSPELFAGDHVLDLVSENETYRQRSIEELQRVVDITTNLKKYFKNSGRPMIVVNIGGFTMDAPMPVAERSKCYSRLLKSLGELNMKDVEIIPQTMPPFPWHFGGQRYQNLFLDPWEIRDFCANHNYRICLDISHSKLACNHNKWSFSEFINIVGPYTAHIHVVDAKGVDGEGLQIQEGEIDFRQLARELAETAPKASFIPEIWQGHKNNGEGFWVALDRLESLEF